MVVDEWRGLLCQSVVCRVWVWSGGCALTSVVEVESRVVVVRRGLCALAIMVHTGWDGARRMQFASSVVRCGVLWWINKEGWGEVNEAEWIWLEWERV